MFLIAQEEDDELRPVTLNQLKLDVAFHEVDEFIIPDEVKSKLSSEDLEKIETFFKGLLDGSLTEDQFNDIFSMD